jgi:myo-inositol-1-phosphate synthase
MKRKGKIAEAEGKLGVLIPGIGGAVSTTFLAGVEAIRQGLALPIGSLTQLGTVRLGKRFEYRIPRIRDFVPLAQLDDLVFAGWDVFPDDCYRAALQANVLKTEHLEPARPFLEDLKPWPAVFNPGFVKNLKGPHLKPQANYLDLVEAIRVDIDTFKREKWRISLCHDLLRQH